MIPNGSFESWLITLAPYFLVLFPVILGYWNSHKLTKLQETASRVEVNSNGHTTALLEMAKTVDPAIAARAAAVLVETAKVNAAAVLQTAVEIKKGET